MYRSPTPRTLIVRQLLIGSLSLAIVATPSMTQACWLTDWLRPKPRTTYYQPQYASAAPPSTCTTTCTKRVCNYIPQTGYRTVYYNVPVTTYRPVTTADPCTGCRTTCWRPATSYVQQARRVPYTTYRQVCQNVVMRPVVTQRPTAGMRRSGSAYGTAYANPAMSYAAPGCSSCSSGPSVGSFPPAQGLRAPSLLQGTGIPPTSAGSPPPNYYNPQTQPHKAAKPQQRSVEKKADPDPAPNQGPDLNARPTIAPPANQPTWKHRTASAPQHRVWTYTTVSWPVQQASHTTRVTPGVSRSHHTDLDDSGWVSVGR